MAGDPTVTSFPHNAKAITPHDTNNLTDHDGNERAQMVRVGDGGDGDVEVIPNGGPDSNVLVFTLAAGDYVPCAVKRVLNGNTTASSLVGLW